MSSVPLRVTDHPDASPGPGEMDLPTTMLGVSRWQQASRWEGRPVVRVSDGADLHFYFDPVWLASFGGDVDVVGVQEDWHGGSRRTKDTRGKASL